MSQHQSQLQLDYAITSTWNGGYVLELVVTNQSESKLPGYQIDFDLDADITQYWGADALTRDGSRYTIHDETAIAAGDSARFKIKALGDDIRMPEAVEIDGNTPSLSDQATRLSDTYTPPDLLGDAYVFDQDERGNDTITVDDSIDAATLNALIDAAPKGATINLAAGDYRFDDAIVVARDDLRLVGAGSDATTLTFTDAALANDTANAIRVTGREGEPLTTLNASANEGDTRLVLADTDAFAVGDVLKLAQPNDDAFLDAIGDSDWRETDSPLRTSMAKITAIDGNTVTLDRGVHFDLEAGATQVAKVTALEGVSLAGFGVAFTLGQPDAGKFSNTLSDLSRYHAVELAYTQGASLEDVSVTNGPSVAFEFSNSLDVSATELSADGSFNKGSGGNGYAFELRQNYDGQFNDLSDSGMRHSVLFASWHSSVGNDITVTSTDRDINFHGGRDHDNRVHVEQSVRDADNDPMSTSVWLNEGESFGAPTAPDANQVTVDYLVGSRRDDTVQAGDDGAYLDGGLGDDTLIGGLGDDILAGGGGWGDNRLAGGAGHDTALFGGALDDYTLTALDDGAWRIKGHGTEDTLSDIELALFDDGQLMNLVTGDVSQVGSPAAITPDAYRDQREVAADESPLHASFDVVSRWSNGYVLGITITNQGDDAVAGDPIRVTLPGTIDTVYGADLNQRDGDVYTLSHAKGDLEAGDSLRISFKAYAETSEIPRAIQLGNRDVAIDEGSLPGGVRLPELLTDVDRQLDGSDILTGGSGNDILTGSAGDDILIGGMGSDRLIGGGGEDRFVWHAAMESTPLSIDEILDFGDDDHIDLSALDADTTQAGHQAFEWQDGKGFSGEAGQLRFDDGQLQGDTNGDGIPELVIGVGGLDHLDPGQLILS
ncbi:cellulose binding domain-containing protein [Salinicola avicenniae]|uniref:cellulose binding domain-containing protein n=1 Tax=Salinicola avicenniae TaxID=2916836 RepID=UPI00255CB487|nr:MULTISPECIES: cellulose binding domain-containing protein [unclassified Salinicola]